MSALSRYATRRDPVMDHVQLCASRQNALGVSIQVQTGAPLSSRDRMGWLAEGTLADIDAPPLVRLLAILSRGLSGNRRAVSAALMLRYGWSSGFLIGAWLLERQVAVGAELQLRFTPQGVLSDVAVSACDDFLGEVDLDEAGLHAVLARELIQRATPIVEAHHQWSGFSRKALWSMVTSSWAAQFIHISELMADPERGLRDARAILGIDPAIHAASPDLYKVEAEGKRGVCQMRQLCCLWFKGPKRQFCCSCPIIEDSDRLARNHARVARFGVADDNTAPGIRRNA